MVMVNDSGIDAGAMQPKGLEKQLRVQEIALENKLPYVQLVESAGANLLAYRVEEFVQGRQSVSQSGSNVGRRATVVTITTDPRRPVAPIKPGCPTTSS